ncbi:MAG TPA: hypothetical protein VEZ11_10175 [Thermoanaerobaculia bacterium]|nr:hypothetical protein [Thermoanaerobaculia bacterium]
MNVLPAESIARVCSDDRRTIRYSVRAPGLKLTSVVLSRESLRRLQADPQRAAKIEYLRRDLLRSVERRAEFRYPRNLGHAKPASRSELPEIRPVPAATA